MQHKKNDNVLRLLTWNLWFQDYLQIERLLALLSYVEPLNPHIIALQELTPVADVFFDDINLPFSETFKSVPFTVPDQQWYWEGVYTRLPFSSQSGRVVYAESEMGRGLTLLHVPSHDLVVGCTHLESENEHPVRRRQFAEAIKNLDSFNAANKILMGDMNTRKGNKLDDLLPSGWIDVWPTLYPEEPGYTRDPARNVFTSKGKAQRLDRIYCKCRDFQPIAMQIIGDEILTTEYGERFMPSDHFGVLLELKPI